MVVLGRKMFLVVLVLVLMCCMRMWLRRGMRDLIEWREVVFFNSVSKIWSFEEVMGSGGGDGVMFNVLFCLDLW